MKKCDIKSFINIVLLVFIVGAAMDLSIFFISNWKEVASSISVAVIYAIKLGVAWFIFSVIVGFAICIVRWMTRLGKNKNDRLNKVYFALIFPFCFFILILTAIGLQLRLYQKYLFPASLHECFFALFGLSILFFVIGILGLLLRGVIKLKNNKKVENDQLCNGSTNNVIAKSSITSEISVKTVVALIVGTSILNRYGLSMGIAGFISVYVVVEVWRRINKQRNNR